MTDILRKEEHQRSCHKISSVNSTHFIITALLCPSVTEIALGLEVEAIDVEFREKFSSQMAITSGDENCFMAYISDQVHTITIHTHTFMAPSPIVAIFFRLQALDITQYL